MEKKNPEKKNEPEKPINKAYKSKIEFLRFKNGSLIVTGGKKD